MIIDRFSWCCYDWLLINKGLNKGNFWPNIVFYIDFFGQVIFYIDLVCTLQLFCYIWKIYFVVDGIVILLSL